MKINIDNSYITFSVDSMDDTEICIDMVYVDANERGRGIGKKLVSLAVDYARDNGFSSVGLYAEPQSDDGLATDALIAFYQSCGFETDGDCSQLMTISIN